MSRSMEIQLRFSKILNHTLIGKHICGWYGRRLSSPLVTRTIYIGGLHLLAYTTTTMLLYTAISPCEDFSAWLCRQFMKDIKKSTVFLLCWEMEPDDKSLNQTGWEGNTTANKCNDGKSNSFNGNFVDSHGFLHHFVTRKKKSRCSWWGSCHPLYKKQL